MDDDQADVHREKTPLDYVTRDQVQDLWGAGFTIVARHQDPFRVPEDIKPRDMFYQWAQVRAPGWSVVPAERHSGYFAPWGYSGEIVVGGQTLVEIPASQAKAKHQANHDKAQKNVDDWYGRQAASGFTGTVTVLSESKDGPKSADLVDIHIVAADPPVQHTKIPPDMLEHLPAIFKERDRLLSLYRRAIQPKGEALDDVIITPEAKAGFTREAIETVRKNLKEAPDAAQSQSHD